MWKPLMNHCLTCQPEPTYLSKLVRTGLRALRRPQERELRPMSSEGFLEVLWREELHRISLL